MQPLPTCCIMQPCCPGSVHNKSNWKRRTRDTARYKPNLAFLVTKLASRVSLGSMRSAFKKLNRGRKPGLTQARCPSPSPSPSCVNALPFAKGLTGWTLVCATSTGFDTSFFHPIVTNHRYGEALLCRATVVHPCWRCVVLFCSVALFLSLRGRACRRLGLCAGDLLADCSNILKIRFVEN